MASVLLQNQGTPPGGVGTGQSRHYCLSSGGHSSVTVEANTQRTTQTPGVYSNLYVRVITNTSNGSCPFRFRKNTADGNQVVTYAAGETGTKQDITNTDSVVAGDIINWNAVQGGTGTTTPSGLCCAFRATTDTTQAYHFNTSVTAFAFGTTNYFTISGDGIGTNVRTDNEIKMGTIGTFQNLGVRLTTNTLDVTGTAVFALALGAAPQALTVTFASGETGYKTDIVNSVAVAVDDLFSMENIITGVSGGITLAIGHLSLTTTNNKTDYVSCVRSTRTASQTRFFNFVGNAVAASTEAPVPLIAQVGSTLSNARAYVSANTWTANFTINLRKNFASFVLGVIFATTETGWKHDLVTTVPVIASDALDWQMITFPGSGSVTTTNVVVTATMAADVVGGSTLLLMGCG